ncbi:MAG: hypothetical protein ACTHJW_17520 [Streptosporangiaceae bacterium]
MAQVGRATAVAFVLAGHHVGGPYGIYALTNTWFVAHGVGPVGDGIGQPGHAGPGWGAEPAVVLSSRIPAKIS